MWLSQKRIFQLIFSPSMLSLCDQVWTSVEHLPSETLGSMTADLTLLLTTAINVCKVSWISDMIQAISMDEIFDINPSCLFMSHEHLSLYIA